jgi:hypothetical protein
MRIFLALGVIFGSLFLFSLIPEFIILMIDIGLVPDEPRFRNSFWFQFQALIALWFIMWILIFIGFFIMWFYTGSIDYGMKKRIKNAKKKAILEYGMELIYFSYIPKKFFNVFALDLSLYPRDVTWKYLSENDKLDIDAYYALPKEQRIELYYKAKEFYGLPDLKEYNLISYIK